MNANCTLCKYPATPTWLALLIALLISSAATAEPFKVMSYNIQADFLENPNQQWLDPVNPRRDRVEAIFDQEDPDLIGMQEVTDSQLPDLINFLPEYDYVRGRNNSFYNAIFYKRDRFQLQDQGIFDLAGGFHHVVWTQLLDTVTNQPFVMFDTHLAAFADQESQRLVQAMQIQAAIPSTAGNLPLILTGDFNFRQTDNLFTPETEHFMEISGRKGTQNRLFGDSFFPLFGSPLPSQQGSRRIDYILNTDDFEVTAADTVLTLVDGLPPSDHWPITSELSLTPIGEERTRWPIQSSLLVDMGLNGVGDFFVHSRYNKPEFFVGVYDVDRISFGRGMADAKFDMRFTLPESTGSSPEVERAVLRLHVTDIIGSLTNGLSLTHAVDDNDFGIEIADYQTTYADTGLDLIVPTGGTGQYYEFDVTDLVLADILADGSNPLASFRLELPAGERPTPGEEAAYIIDTRLFAPQLVITFVPEPSTLLLGVLVAVGILLRREKDNNELPQQKMM